MSEIDTLEALYEQLAKTEPGSEEAKRISELILDAIGKPEAK